MEETSKTFRAIVLDIHQLNALRTTKTPMQLYATHPPVLRKMRL